MPLYEFECAKCGSVDVKYRALEDYQSYQCESTAACGGTCTKIPSAPAIVYQRKYQLNGKEWG